MKKYFIVLLLFLPACSQKSDRALAPESQAGQSRAEDCESLGKKVLSLTGTRYEDFMHAFVENLLSENSRCDTASAANYLDQTLNIECHDYCVVQEKTL